MIDLVGSSLELRRRHRLRGALQALVTRVGGAGLVRGRLRVVLVLAVAHVELVIVGIRLLSLILLQVC